MNPLSAPLIGDEFARSFLDAVHLGLLVLDAHGNVLQANVEAARLIGRPAPDLIGTNVIQVVSLDPEGQTLWVDLAATTGARQTSVSGWIQRPDDVRHTCDILLTTLSPSARPARWVLSLRDSVEDEARVTRVREIVKLEAMTNLGRHLGNHFNNALTAINGHLEAARALARDDAPETAEIAGAYREARRAAWMVRHLLTATEPGTSDLRVVEPGTVIRQCAEAIRRELEPRSRVEIRLEHGDWLITADAQQLCDILLALTQNARDAMPHGGVLQLRTAQSTVESDREVPTEAADREFVRLDVVDTGEGIPSEILPHIFEPFFTTKGNAGSGLGLASVYEILKQHQGGVTVESKPANGTAFHFFFPRAAVTDPVEPPRDEPQSGSETVLVVDDERSVRRIVRKTLEQFGYAVLEAANGEEGIRLFTEQGPRIQLVILDIVMPGISGWDVLRAIKAHRPALPVIVQSGYVVSGNHPEDTPLKADAFLRKPYELAELLQTVRQVLDAPAYRNR